MVFYMITWKEFINRKLKDMSEIVKGEDGDILMNNMKAFNAQKRATTTDYRCYNLSEMLENKSIELIEKVSDN